jgi:hypothetical protein
LRNQTLRIDANGQPLGEFPVEAGDFQLTVDVPPEFERQLLSIQVKASRWLNPGRFKRNGDDRRLAWQFKSIGWAEPPEMVGSRVVPAYAGQ